MSPFDLHHSVDVETALNTGTISSDTNTDGNEIDTANFHAIEFVVTSGAITDGAYALTVLESDTSGGSFTVAADDDILGLGTAFALADDNVSKRIGYIGKKRYVKLRIVSTSTTSGGVFVASVVKGTAFNQPVADN